MSRRLLSGKGFSHGGGGGGLAFNATVTNNFATASSFNFPGLTAAANCINVVQLGWNSFGSTVTISTPTDSLGTTYVQLGGGNPGGLGLYYGVVSSAQSGNIINVVTSGATTLAGSVTSFTGVNASAPVDTGGTFTGATSGPTPAPAWTTSVANTILIGNYGPNSGQFTVSGTAGGGTWQLLPSPNTSYFSGFVYCICSSTVAGVAPTISGDSGLFASVTSALKA
jgi:hypothetical protein